MVKYVFWFAWTTCIFFTTARSQDQRVVDSLHQSLKEHPGGERFPFLYELTFQYIRKDKARALRFITAAESAALLSGDSLWIVKSRRVKGQLLYLLERSAEAVNVLNAALPVAIRNDYLEEEYYIQIGLGKLDLFRGKYDKALHFYFTALEVASRLDDLDKLSGANHSVGIGYYKLKNYLKALEFLFKSLDIRPDNDQGESSILANIGLCYAQLGEFSKARYYVQIGLDKCGAGCPGGYRVNIDYAFGLIAQGEGNYRIAENYFLESYRLARELGNTRFQFDNIYLLAEMFIELKNYERAEYYLLEAEKLIGPKTPYNLEMIKIYSAFYDFYFSVGDLRKALIYQSKYVALKDSIYNEKLTANLMEVEARFLERENAAKIASQEEMIVLKEEVIAQQQKVNVITVILTVVSVLLLIFVFWNYQKNKSLNVRLDRKIRERTSDLELNRRKLMVVLKNYELTLSRSSHGMTERMNTLKGLCAAASGEISDPLALSYVDKIHDASCRLDEYLRSMLVYSQSKESLNISQ